MKILEERDKGLDEDFDSEDEAVLQGKLSVEAKQEYLRERRQARVLKAYAKLKSSILSKPLENPVNKLFDQEVINSL